MTNQQIYVKNEAKIRSFEGQVGSPPEKLFGNSVKTEEHPEKFIPCLRVKCCPVRKHNFVEKVHKKMPKCKINFSFLTIKSSRVILGLFQLCPQMHIPQQKNLRPQFVEQYLRKRYNETPQVPKMIQHGRILYLLISLILYLFSLYVRVCLVFVIRISYFCTKSTSYDYRTI